MDSEWRLQNAFCGCMRGKNFANLLAKICNITETKFWYQDSKISNLHKKLNQMKLQETFWIGITIKFTFYIFIDSQP